MQLATDSPRKMIHLFVVLFIPTLLQGQQATPQPALEVIELKFEQAAGTIMQLEQQRSSLNEQLRQKAQQIQRVREKKTLNFLEKQRLEALLRESQDLGNQISQIDTKLRQANQAYATIGSQLVRRYEAVLDSLLAELEESKVGAEARQKRVQRVEALRKRKEEVQQRIGGQALGEIEIHKLEIAPHDTPKRIRQKADLLKDQEDKHRRLSRQLERRTEELRKELRLRNRIGDLVTELALFDQQEEAIGNLDAAANQATELALSEDAAVTAGARGTETLILVGQKDFDFSTLSAEQLEDAIDVLKERQALAESRADSLAQEAERFYQAAKEYKKQ
ncbi:MAG: hypothetical protein ACE5IY_19605 [bacterium]